MEGGNFVYRYIFLHVFSQRYKVGRSADERIDYLLRFFDTRTRKAAVKAALDLEKTFGPLLDLGRSLRPNSSVLHAVTSKKSTNPALRYDIEMQS